MPDDSDRDLSLDDGLGESEVHLIHVDANEGLSQPFLISLTIARTNPPIDILSKIGKPITVEARLFGELQRYFHGVVTDGYYVDTDAEFGNVYRLMLQPKTFFQENGRNFKVFQEKSVIDIVKEVLTDCAIDFESKVSGGSADDKGNRVRAFCVQYGESNFGFVCRLLEEEGLFYFYRHEQGKHVLVICDTDSVMPALPEDTLTYNSEERFFAGAHTSEGGSSRYVNSWQQHVNSSGVGKVKFRDYDFKQSTVQLESLAEKVRDSTDEPIEVYHWPGRYYKSAEGDALTLSQLRSRSGQRDRFEGTSTYQAFAVGHLFTLEDHHIAAYDQKYLVTHCHLAFASENFRSSMHSGENAVDITAIPAEVKFCPPIVTSRPIVRGPETAVVTGPGGEEIYVDEFGRVKIKFHWDRLGQNDDTSSCWVRVAQTGGLGNIIIPRIGDEVLVDFIGGDPDRPIIVGRLYNDQHKPEYTLPDHKTRALWRSKRYKEESSASYPDAKELASLPDANKVIDDEYGRRTYVGNELRFEDKTGEEELVIFAERDLHSRVRNDESHLVARDTTTNVGRDRLVKILGTDTLDVTDKIKIDSGTEIAITAQSKITLTVGGSSITLDSSSIKTVATMLDMKGQSKADLAAPMTTIKADGILTAQGGLVKIN